MSPQLREKVADLFRAQIAPKNNCQLVGVNLKTKNEVENAVAVCLQNLESLEFNF